MCWRKLQQNETQSVPPALCFLEIYDSQHLSTDCISYWICPQNKHNTTIGLEGKCRLRVFHISLLDCQVVLLGLCFFLSLEISHSWLNLDWDPVSYKNSVFCVTSCSRCIHKGECARCKWTRVSPATTCQVKFVGEGWNPLWCLLLVFLTSELQSISFLSWHGEMLIFFRIVAMQLLRRGSPLRRKQRLVSILRSALFGFSELGDKFR